MDQSDAHTPQQQTKQDQPKPQERNEKLQKLQRKKKGGKSQQQEKTRGKEATGEKREARGD